MARAVGVEISRYSPSGSEDARLIAMLSAHKVNLVLDVGANTGQFGQVLRRAGYTGRIVSFEPLSAARDQLLRVSSGDARWEVADRCAIGDADGEIDLHIAGNSVSSSLLPMLSSHTQAAPESAYVGSERTVVRKLDVAAKPYLRSDSVVFLKIDTQGYEDRVLRGAPELIERIAGLQLEMSFVPLYEGQMTFDQLRGQLTPKGFELWGISPAFIDPKVGRLLQIDATFFR